MTLDKEKLNEVIRKNEQLLRELTLICRTMQRADTFHPWNIWDKIWYKKQYEAQEGFVRSVEDLRVMMNRFTFSSDSIEYECLKVEAESEFRRCFGKWQVEMVAILRKNIFKTQRMGENMKEVEDEILDYIKKVSELV